ncbi:hypothetical protein C942_00505 [Photobacterium marinum]|uniref:Phage tail length tape-measure protein n=1 Tax=Photobacterium marinum TaxID=1056511 RepID=L8JCP1_9GAMM|nr:hypothetical protein [Photobacterium marinum]ELR66063.1 hypothetical protein C942_00505 [Photobacterium marinum]
MAKTYTVARLSVDFEANSARFQEALTRVENHATRSTNKMIKTFGEFERKTRMVADKFDSNLIKMNRAVKKAFAPITVSFNLFKKSIKNLTRPFRTVYKVMSAPFIKLYKLLDKVKNKISGVGKAVTSLISKFSKFAMITGGAAVAGLLAFTIHAAQTTLEMQRLGDRVGIGYEKMNALNLIASMSGVTLEQVTDAMKDLSVRTQDAALAGSGALLPFFIQINESASEWAKMDAATEFERFSDVLSKLPLQQAQFWADEINDSMYRMLPILRQGASYFRKMTDEAKLFEVSLDNREAIMKMQANLARLKGVAVGFFGNIAGEVSKMLDEPMTNAIEGFTKKAKESGGVDILVRDTVANFLVALSNIVRGFDTFKTSLVSILKTIQQKMIDLGLLDDKAELNFRTKIDTSELDILQQKYTSKETELNLAISAGKSADEINLLKSELTDLGVEYTSLDEKISKGKGLQARQANYQKIQAEIKKLKDLENGVGAFTSIDEAKAINAQAKIVREMLQGYTGIDKQLERALNHSVATVGNHENQAALLTEVSDIYKNQLNKEIRSFNASYEETNSLLGATADKLDDAAIKLKKQNNEILTNGRQTNNTMNANLKHRQQAIKFAKEAEVAEDKLTALYKKQGTSLEDIKIQMKAKTIALSDMTSSTLVLSDENLAKEKQRVSAYYSFVVAKAKSKYADLIAANKQMIEQSENKINSSAAGVDVEAEQENIKANNAAIVKLEKQLNTEILIATNKRNTSLAGLEIKASEDKLQRVISFNGDYISLLTQSHNTDMEREKTNTETKLKNIQYFLSQKKRYYGADSEEYKKLVEQSEKAIVNIKLNSERKQREIRFKESMERLRILGLSGELAVAQVDQNERKELDSLKDGLNDKLVSYEEYEKRKTQIQKKYADKRADVERENSKRLTDAFITWAGKQSSVINSFTNNDLANLGDAWNNFFDENSAGFKDWGAVFEDSMKLAGSLIGQISDMYFSSKERELDARKKALDDEIDKRKESIEQNDSITDQEKKKQLQALEKEEKQRNAIINKERKKAFEQKKKYQMAEALMNIATGVTSALTVAPPVGFVLAGMVAAMGAAQLSMISGQQYSGQAHSGIDEIPNTGNQTWMLQGGERVVQKPQNVKLKRFLDEWDTRKVSQQAMSEQLVKAVSMQPSQPVVQSEAANDSSYSIADQVQSTYLEKSSDTLGSALQRDLTKYNQTKEKAGSSFKVDASLTIEGNVVGETEWISEQLTQHRELIAAELSDLKQSHGY